MHKVATSNPGTARDPAATTSRVLPFPTAGDRTNRTSVCAVLFLDIVEYSKKPVSEQLQIKERFNTHIAGAIAAIPSDERIILDTGDGVAISFLADPEDALFVAINLADALRRDSGARVDVRAGINLGPVRLVRDLNSQPNIIGDGINVAQRVMSFAQPTRILVSRSYYEVVTRISEDYARLFAYQGSRTDKHVREHEIYEVVAPAEEARELIGRRNRARRPGEDTLSSTVQARPGLFRSRKLATAFTGLSLLCLAAAAYYSVTSRLEAPALDPVVAASGPASAAPTAALEPAPQPAANVPEPAAPLPQSDATVIEPKSATKPASRRKAAPVQQPATKGVDMARIEPEPRKAVPATRSGPHASKSAAGGTAFILLAVSPWGEVFVDGKSAGVSPPLTELEVSAGKHRVEIRNGAFKPYQEEIELGSNQTFRIKHKFTPQR